MEFFYEDALAEATKLDAILKETGKPVGPLHGLPMSVKEHFNFKDHVTHAGYVGWLDRVSPEFADTTKQLIDCGAVIFCRTTEPQSLMHLDSYNNIVGRCRNPNNTFLSPGGSSSGEGAMVAMGGSALGMGSDGGGSIRAPSAFCGIYGLKATAQRISIKGFTVSVAGIEGFIGVIGPMTRFVEDLDLFMTAILNFANPWKYDPFLTVVPWRPVEDPKPTSLKIGVVFDDGIVRPHANIKRALETVVGKLKEQGVEIVSFKPPRHEEAMRAIMKVYSGDGNECQKDALAISGEPINPLTTWTLSFGDGDEGMPVRDLYRTSVTKGEVRQEYLDMMNNESIDFILSPTYVGCAPVPDTLHYWGYTCIYNLLDMPNVVFPTGLYSDSTLDKPENFKPRNEYEEYEHKLFEDPAIFDGAPLNLQLTGKRFSDEKLVKAVKVISEIIKT
ncbi:unnamed protein product [Kuraishia capsulata CBS 1993]|uniref:amidase n=1 Tax=Kuraishia capsulata CBS 1993 TaxID=1382522 RepID=W6MSE8_9ASCO|nr:uncharacterized protein KUCA_T00005301001 [Kuraishia capsulata CBS 1993]CDK29313.1 unnamed protein product [Kuraishia capsulata CBS 1993]